MHARNSFKNKVFERGLSKTLKKLTIFLLNPFLFNGQSYQIQKGPRTSDQLLFRLQTKLTKISLLVMYYPTKFINIKWFWVIPKMTPGNLCKPIHDIIIIPLPFVLYNTGSVEKKGKNYKNLNILRMKRAF